MRKFVLIVFVLCTMVSVVHADDVTDTNIDIYNSNTITDLGNQSDPQYLIELAANYIVDFLLFAAGAAGMIMIGYGGTSYVIAGADETKLAKAKRILVYAVISLVLAAMSWVIRGATTRNIEQLQTDPNATIL